MQVCAWKLKICDNVTTKVTYSYECGRHGYIAVYIIHMCNGYYAHVHNYVTNITNYLWYFCFAMTLTSYGTTLDDAFSYDSYNFC